MADYRKEMKKLRKHRRLYRPAMSRVLDLYNRVTPSDLPIELIDDRDILTILELIDVGYLDEEALVAKHRFGSVTGLRYNGAYPFTEEGTAFYRAHRTFISTILDTLRGRQA